MRPFPAELRHGLAGRFRVALCRPRPGETPSPEVDNEEGSAVVEFTFLALLLMVPLVYFIVTVGQLQSGAFAVVGAADQAAKVYVAQEDAGKARTAAEQAAMLTLADYGHPAEHARIEISCDRADCMSAGATVTVNVNLTVPLPMVPFGDLLRLDAGRLDATASQLVGRFR
jgi:Flp pilus assembly protein TadG